MSQRQDFIELAGTEGRNFSALCRRFGISRSSGYELLRRFHTAGPPGLLNRSSRPHSSPNRTVGRTEEAILAIRDSHPAWGCRKIRRRLLTLGFERVPSASTVSAILSRNGRIERIESLKHRPMQRFEHEEPNELWQMDFKGHFRIGNGRCHPLTLLDDHSRYSLALRACAAERGVTVRQHLEQTFRAYGLPQRILIDNGAPWSAPGDYVHTRLTAWLLRLGVAITHSRPYHPQTMGKDERFHRTLKAELLRGRQFEDLEDCQKSFDRWRYIYNHERPHEALKMEPPAARYHPSRKPFPDCLPPVEYDSGDEVRRVAKDGHISYKGRKHKVGEAFSGFPVAIRPTTDESLSAVYFCHCKVTEIDLQAG